MIELRQIGRHALTAFGVAYNAEPKILSFDGDGQLPSLDLVECINVPQLGVTSYATVGMSRFDNASKVNGKDLRVELVVLFVSSSGVWFRALW
jgi:hypothetical protein